MRSFTGHRVFVPQTTAVFTGDHGFSPPLEVILTIRRKRPSLVPIPARAFVLSAGLSRKPLELPHGICDHLWFQPRCRLHR